MGSGHADIPASLAKRFPNRKYAVVEPLMAPGKKFDYRARELIKRGVLVFPGSISRFLDFMKKNGLKTRHINVDMPEPLSHFGDYDFDKLFREAPNVLLPNGKIFFSTEEPALIKILSELAGRHGLKARKLNSFPSRIHPNRKTGYMQLLGQPVIYRVEITFGLKKAFSKKFERKKLQATA